MKKISLVISILLISTLINVPLTEARSRHNRGDAVAAGLLGLGIGMAIAAPNIYYYYRDDDYYHRYPYYRRYWRRHHYPHRHRHYDYDVYDRRDDDWRDD
jgi:hypothetical protein